MKDLRKYFQISNFPNPLNAPEDGVLCFGGDFEMELLLDAYLHGIFPWPMWENEPMAWWSLDPRAIIPLDGFHISRRLRRTIRSGKFQVTCDHDFAGVIRGCATAPGRGVGSTWLTTAMIDAYCRMHELGHAHSVEVWYHLPLPLEEGRGDGSLIRSERTATTPPRPRESLASRVRLPAEGCPWPATWKRCRVGPLRCRCRCRSAIRPACAAGW